MTNATINACKMAEGVLKKITKRDKMLIKIQEHCEGRRSFLFFIIYKSIKDEISQDSKCVKAFNHLVGLRPGRKRV